MQIDDHPADGFEPDFLVRANMDFRLRVHDDAWVRRLALGLAGVARVTDPPELAEQIREVAAAALAAYGD